jgi:hypothetical protein
MHEIYVSRNRGKTWHLYTMSLDMDKIYALYKELKSRQLMPRVKSY